MGDDSSFRDALVGAIHRHDRAGAVGLALEALDRRSVSIAALYDLLSETLVGIGSDWQSGDAQVWQEHLVTGIVRTIVEASTSRVEEEAPDDRVATVVLAAPDEEYHDLGLRMLADRFILVGWRAHFLGADVPVGEVVAAIRELGADAACLSASTHFHRLSLRPYVARLAESFPGLRIWAGGPAFAHEQAGWPDGMVLDPRSIPAPEEA